MSAPMSSVCVSRVCYKKYGLLTKYSCWHRKVSHRNFEALAERESLVDSGQLFYCKKWRQKSSYAGSCRRLHCRVISYANADGLNDSPSKTLKTKKQNGNNTEKTRHQATYDIPTPPGQKKDTTSALPSAYSSEFVEAAWYAWWVQQGYFKPDTKVRSGVESDRFVMCLPPPNVTGTLHLGHALTCSIQDAIARWHRMKGRSVLWIPGCDHAGIATQVVVEKRLAQECGISRHDIGREHFIQEVWKWKQEKEDSILQQMRRLGSSLDWSRACFTMDEKLSSAVTEAFVRLHDEGFIFRSKRMVSWCCQLKSAISDIEIEDLSLDGPTKIKLPGYEEEVEMGTITTFSYPVVGSDEVIAVATTRPETMLGDTAVAVHPDDPRYTNLHGAKVWNPLSNRSFPVVCDTYVDQNFGTGAVKITPAHDPNDTEIGRRHGLPSINVIDDEGKMENVPEKYCGMKRFHARAAVIQDLKDLGLYRDTQPHSMVLPFCSRSKDVIERRLKDQWFLNCKEMADHAIKSVNTGKLKLIPSSAERSWFHWLNECEDWCLSRQIWWGHRVPAYLVTINSQPGKEEMWIIGRTEEEAKTKAARQLGVSPDLLCLQQDEDVLDTWFSSALFPFSSLGWPNQTADLERFYPTSLLETGSDIMFFWVARMVMLGYKLTGRLPFTEVLLHGTLRDAHGRKMSKSLGNVIDPMDVIHGISLQELQQQVKRGNLDPSEVTKAQEGQAKDFPQGIKSCGTDALRFGLCSIDYSSQAVNLDMGHIESKRRMCNKIWQGFSFVKTNLGPDFTPAVNFKSDVTVTNLMDQWILSRLSHMVMSCDKHFADYKLHVVTESLQTFWINDFCDIYLESVKHVLRGDDSRADTARQVLCFCVNIYLRALSPFMPYLTEELYQRLPMAADWPESVCISQYPTTEDVPYKQDRLEEAVTVVKLLKNIILSVGTRYSIKARTLPVILQVQSGDLVQILTEKSVLTTLQTLSRAGSVDFLPPGQAPPQGSHVMSPHPQVQIFLMLKGIIDPKKEIAQLEKKLQRLEKTEKKKFKKKPEDNADFIKLQKEKEVYMKEIAAMKKYETEQ
ncbi:valine--tRNA ligase-like [Mizuhopecten yessoensis]|uniref:valine--tRNA ligase-like n=1 Tax=Mizuhopecten yessoensis TaxID=6573 RepID=UPI000B45B7FE|nr:valine--tRNA ligase-like [Mizuhopecten yessoensis]